jgi:hypothetical protein
MGYGAGRRARGEEKGEAKKSDDVGVTEGEKKRESREKRAKRWL